nr:hypothetical protein [Terribacillus saccharophilus]
MDAYQERNDDLLYHLKSDLGKLSKLEPARERLKKLQKDSFSLTKRIVLAIILGPFMTSMLVSTILLLVLEQLHIIDDAMRVVEEHLFMSMLPGVIVSFLVFYFIFTFISRSIKRTKKPKILREQQVIGEMEGTLENSIVPAYYLYTGAIRMFIHYLETYQASDLRDCITLYEEHLKHSSLVSELQSVSSSIDSMNSEMNSMSSEMDRMRRDMH